MGFLDFLSSKKKKEGGEPTCGRAANYGDFPRPDTTSGRNALCPVVSFALLLGFGLSLKYSAIYKLKRLIIK